MYTHNYCVPQTRQVLSYSLFFCLCVGTEALVCLPVCTLAAGIAVGYAFAARTELDPLMYRKGTVSAAAKLITSSLVRPTIFRVAGSKLQVII